MIEKDYIEFFEISTDAISTNRGFYYQYLVTLKKWILNYTNKKENFIYCEVDDDIKEIGSKLIFTQVKCYSNTFSLKSDEIKKSIFNFYIQYLKNNQSIPIEFCFYTNTSISPREKLLQAWVSNPELKDREIAKQVLKIIKEILNAELNKHKRRKLEKKNITSTEKDIIKDFAVKLKQEVANLEVDTFPKHIKWEFLDYNPISAVNSLFAEIRVLLSNEIFKNKPIQILESVFLSEIFRCSQLPEKNKRVLSNSRITELLNETDSGLEKYIDERVLTLLNVRFIEIEQNFKSIQNIQDSFEKRLDSFDEILNKTSAPQYPKNLTFIPQCLNAEFYGRQDSIECIKERLIKSNSLYIKGCGGTGKTFLVQQFINSSQNQYDHIAWFNSSPNLLKSILLDSVFIENLNVAFDVQNTDDDKINLVCNKLSQVNGKNLLIIDKYENDLNVLKKFLFLNNWQIIITTTGEIPEISCYKLPCLDIESSIKIFSRYCSKLQDDKNIILLDFFSYIDYNPLAIKLFAQTIENSIDLTVESLFNSIKEQKLDDENIEIELELIEEDFPITLLSFLQKKFELKNLTTNEELYLEFLSLLPSDDIDIVDIALIGGKEFYKKNLKDFTNWTNSLQRKGWLERVDGKIKMYRLVQEVIVYNTRKQPNGFISCMFLITWLFRRIDEVAQSNPSLSFRFLKYAESILKSIKEEYRQSIYQPLLLLENALLNAYNWIENTDSLHKRWIDLIKRSENYLSPDDTNLGIIYNNLGYSYARRGDVNSAIIYFEKSVNTLKKNEEKAINVLLNSLNNKTQAFLVLDDLPSALDSLKKSNMLIKKYSLENIQFVAAQNYLNAVYLMKSGDYNQAADKYNLAIETHLKINKSDRNDFMLMIYYSNLVYMLFKAKHDEKVIENIDNIYELIEEYKMDYFKISIEVKTMIDNIKEYYKLTSK